MKSCREARYEIALLAGGDLDPGAARNLQQHLQDCAECRQASQLLTRDLEVLQVCRSVDERLDQFSVWPEVQTVLAARAAEAGIRRFNGWAATVAVAATVLALVTISQQFGSASRGSTEFGSEMGGLSSPVWRLEGASQVDFSSDPGSVSRGGDVRDQRVKPPQWPRF